jgi:succinate dehydrogenase cytochrome b556 subunit
LRPSRPSLDSYTATKPGGGKVVRPLSPHLTVYSFKENMLTSIVFRGTGILMFGGLVALGGVALVGKHKFPAYVYALQQMPALNFLVKFFAAFPLTYHLLGGLRHLAWDNIMFHSLKDAKTSGYAALGTAAAVAVIASVMEAEPE